MADRKVFAGPRIRRKRRELGLTQTAMATGLGVSPSYLNLIERNQRPLTVQLLLKLASAYDVEPDSLRDEGGVGAVALREVFADPLLAGEVPGDQELLDVAEAAPNAATGIVKLYRAYREQHDRLSDLSGLLAEKGHQTALSAATLPADQVREIFETGTFHFPRLEEAAEAFRKILEPDADLGTSLKAWLRARHGVTVRKLPADAMPLWRKRFDRHSMRLFLSEILSAEQRLMEMVLHAVRLQMEAVITAEMDALSLTGDEARRLARFELGRYAALAVMMPYEEILNIARRELYDIERLAGRFDAAFDHVAMRLVALKRSGNAGIPFFLVEVDMAGNRMRSYGAGDLARTAFGKCPRLCLYSAFQQPGRVLAERAVMPDKSEFLTLARTIRRPRQGFSDRVRHTALMLACPSSYADETVYGQTAGLSGAAPVAIGPACRICERQGCPSRAAPPVTRPLSLDESVAGLSGFDFQ